jgi:hypothetical protein
MIDQEFDSAMALWRDSAIYRTARLAVTRTTAAIDESALLRSLRNTPARLNESRAAHLVAAAAMTLAWASLAHLAMRSLLPRYATSGLPWWWNVTLAMCAVAVAALAAPITTAWRDSMPGRFWRRVTR